MDLCQPHNNYLWSADTQASPETLLRARWDAACCSPHREAAGPHTRNAAATGGDGELAGAAHTHARSQGEGGARRTEGSWEGLAAAGPSGTGGGCPPGPGVTLGLPRPPESGYCPRAGEQSQKWALKIPRPKRVGRRPRGPGLMRWEGRQRPWGPAAPRPAPMVSAGRSPLAVPSLPLAAWEQHTCLRLAPPPGHVQKRSSDPRAHHQHTRLTEARRVRLRAGGVGSGGPHLQRSNHKREVT